MLFRDMNFYAIYWHSGGADCA